MGKFAKWLLLLSLGLFVVVTVLVNLLPTPPDAPARSAVARVAVPATVATATPVMPMPAVEAQFIAILDAGAHRFAAGANDMAKGAARPARGRAVCALFKYASGADWVGTVSKLSSNSDGKGVLVVRISPIASLKTWNNELSDSGDHTLIDPTSALFQEASALKEGQAVVFSGHFVASQTDCVREIQPYAGGIDDRAGIHLPVLEDPAGGLTNAQQRDGLRPPLVPARALGVAGAARAALRAVRGRDDCP